MKTRFNTYDIVCGVAEVQKLVGLRVNQIYDIDKKTFLFRLQGVGGAEKVTLLIESGTRFHTTAFEWPKNMAPSGFSMKLRKHLKNKRLENVTQLGMDRIVDFQFGTGDAAFHFIIELYDRGNAILTDCEMTILYILRPHTEGEDVRFAVREKYPMERARKETKKMSLEQLTSLVKSAPPGESLKRTLMSSLDCGPAIIDHVLLLHGLDNCVTNGAMIDEAQLDAGEPQKTKKLRKPRNRDLEKLKMRPLDLEKDLTALTTAIEEADELLSQGRKGEAKGYIIQVQEEKPAAENEQESGKVEHFHRNVEFHPYLFEQFKGQPFLTFDSFLAAVDEFFSTQESQKIDMKTLQQEREALKKLSNVKKDHAKRLEELNKVQDVDKRKAELITSNQALVDKAILAVQSAIASQLSWPDIHELVKEAQSNGDAVASCIKQLKLEINHISLMLTDPYDSDHEQDSENSMVIDIDLALSAWANARRYYDLIRTAAQKEQKTVDASKKALKSAERKTQSTLKEVRTINTIAKARKVYWFEKFYWFISSENYLVIGGRDAQQNELIVKRYMRPKDIYVHAEIQGASSVIIRNPTGEEVPPKTLLEAGTMAISYSVAWDAKVVTNAYWVQSEQVTKTAPTGEYLGTGSFMVRGKKNFLPSCHLIMGLSLLFKIEESFVHRHAGERQVRNLNEDQGETKFLDIKEVEVENEELLKINEEDENESLDDERSQDDEETTAFPNTEVKIEHDTGQVTVSAKPKAQPEPEPESVEETTIIAAAPVRKKQQQNAKKRKDEKNRQGAQAAQTQQSSAPEGEGKTAQVKRGQRSKLKKMKSKYKDQDDEERELRMMILNSSGKEKPSSNDVKSNPKFSQADKEGKKDAVPKNVAPKNIEENDEIDEMAAGAGVEMLDSLTGQPFLDDEVLFAIPVVAPYQALQQYKYKVKLTPGTGKRGRAAKMALTIFAKDKSCNAREKDLLKSIKEEALARNIPGKVKLSAPQLQKLRK